MSLQQADWHDILKVLHETVHIWSSGLTPLDYRWFLASQMQSPWFRKNCRFMVYKTGGIIRSSCKLYTLEYSYRGGTYRLAGLGAVYTQLNSRGSGFASELINEVLDFCEEENYDGVVLYSEIGTDFYADFGFEECGSVDFQIEGPLLRSPIDLPKSGRQVEHNSVPGARPLGLKDIPFLQRHYKRWLRSQPFGLIRSEDYWSYKLKKEEFLHRHSRSGWGALHLLKADTDDLSSAYSIFEIREESIRVLEIVGSDSGRRKIWANLLTQILKGRNRRLQGWEAVIRDLAPAYKISSLGLEIEDGESSEVRANTSKSEPSGSKLSGAKLSGSKPSGCKPGEFKPSYSKLDESKLNESKLNESKLNESKLSGSKHSGVEEIQSEYTESVYISSEPDLESRPEQAALSGLKNLDLFCTPREWGQGMILCLNTDLQHWLSVNPCPMLELDHL